MTAERTNAPQPRNGAGQGRLLLVLLMTLLLVPSRTAAAIGTWRHHLAYRDVQRICKAGDELFVLASNGLYRYGLNDQAITTYDKTNGLSDTNIAHIGWSQAAGRLIVVYANANIDLVETDGDVVNLSALYNKTMADDKTVTDVRIDGVHAYLVTSFAIIKVNMERAEITDTYTPSHPDYPTSLPENDKTDEETYRPLVARLTPPGPTYNHFYESRFVKGKLYTTGGYFRPGIPDPARRGIVQAFDGSDWTLYEEEISQKTGHAYKDVCCIDVDPTDTTHVFAGGRCGLYEFRNGRLTAWYDRDNSPLKGAVDRGVELGNDYVLVLGVKFDSKGSLWVLNSQARGVSLLELTKDHQWVSHHQDVMTDDKGLSLPALQNMSFDSRGLLWFVNNNWFDPSLFCFDPSQETILKYDDFTNQDGKTYDVKWVYCTTTDKEGNVWVGTDLGPFMIQNGEVGQSQVTFRQVKVPRNDGTNYADYLLNGISIRSMAVDGGNQKWFGTDDNGAFLISADNMEQLANFTTDNSKLIDNTIASIAIDPRTGVVHFLTDGGLCSYQGNATEPSDEMTSDQVYAYPNPVTPDHTGLITVTGLTYDADVKIVATNGALIAEGRSNGGLFTWDGTDRKGRRVASGVYMVVTATSDGRRGTVCKIAIIR